MNWLLSPKWTIYAFKRLTIAGRCFINLLCRCLLAETGWKDWSNKDGFKIIWIVVINGQNLKLSRIWENIPKFLQQESWHSCRSVHWWRKKASLKKKNEKRKKLWSRVEAFWTALDQRIFQSGFERQENMFLAQLLIFLHLNRYCLNLRQDLQMLQPLHALEDLSSMS